MSKFVILIFVVLGVGIMIGFLVFRKTERQTDNSSYSTSSPTISPAISLTSSQGFSNISDNSSNKMHLITIKTNLGDIQFETFDVDAPKTVNNFVTLADKGFYNNLTFHRVVKNFVIQGGDPNGDGTGGPGYTFEDELNSNTESYKTGYKKGVVAMANAGPNTNGSQFFIMLADVSLPHNYTIFGRVVKGQEVVDKIGQVQTGLNDKPINSVVMTSVIVSKKNN